MGRTDLPVFDSCTPPVMATKISESGINMFHTYLDLSGENQEKVDNYVKMLSERADAYKNKRYTN